MSEDLSMLTVAELLVHIGAANKRFQEAHDAKDIVSCELWNAELGKYAEELSKR